MDNHSVIRDKNNLTEKEFLLRYKEKSYKKPSLTSDVAIFRKGENGLQILLIRRANHPFLGSLALPGGFANENEPLEETAKRELCEETGIEDCTLDLVGVFSSPQRDPRGWVVSCAYLGKVSADIHVCSGDDAAGADWYDVKYSKENDVMSCVLSKDQDMTEICWKRTCQIGKDAQTWNYEILSNGNLAFDHAHIIACALNKIGF